MSDWPTHLCAEGGVRVVARSRLAEVLAGRPAHVLHVGGELLTCSAWQAAVILRPPGDVAAKLAYLDGWPVEQRGWVRRVLGCDDAAPYLLPRAALPGVERIAHIGLGGVDLERRSRRCAPRRSPSWPTPTSSSCATAARRRCYRRPASRRAWHPTPC
jgi:hypothetical protein